MCVLTDENEEKPHLSLSMYTLKTEGGRNKGMYPTFAQKYVYIGNTHAGQTMFMKLFTKLIASV